MTSLAGQHAPRATAQTAAVRPAMARFFRALKSWGGLVVNAFQTAHALETARTPAARRAVLDRLLVENDRHVSRSAA